MASAWPFAVEILIIAVAMRAMSTIAQTIESQLEAMVWRLIDISLQKSVSHAMNRAMPKVNKGYLITASLLRKLSLWICNGASWSLLSSSPVRKRIAIAMKITA